MTMNKQHIKQMVKDAMQSRIKDASSDMEAKLDQEADIIKVAFPKWQKLDKSYDKFVDDFIAVINDPKNKELGELESEFKSRFEDMVSMAEILNKIDKAYAWIQVRAPQ